MKYIYFFTVYLLSILAFLYNFVPGSTAKAQLEISSTVSIFCVLSIIIFLTFTTKVRPKIYHYFLIFPITLFTLIDSSIRVLNLIK